MDSVLLNEIKVTVRDNYGKDVDYSCDEIEKAQVLVNKVATPENHMIVIYCDGVREERWDRERFIGENRWFKTDPDEVETIGQIRQLKRG